MKIRRLLPTFGGIFLTILALDSSGTTASVALINEYITIGEITINAQSEKRKTHSEILLPMIDQLFSFTGMDISNVDYIACTNGPGSFTGLRIGAATAKGLSRGIGKPVIAVPTLDAMAYNIVISEPGFLIVPLMDARRSQVYTALYKWKGNVLVRHSDYIAESIENVLKTLASIPISKTYTQIVFLGDGVPIHQETIINSGLPCTFALPHQNRQRAASVGICAFHLAAAGCFCNEEDFPLLYIRKPQAERERDERSEK